MKEIAQFENTPTTKVSMTLTTQEEPLTSARHPIRRHKRVKHYSAHAPRIWAAVSSLGSALESVPSSIVVLHRLTNMLEILFDYIRFDPKSIATKQAWYDLLKVIPLLLKIHVSISICLVQFATSFRLNASSS